jgi:hypothetical protein
MPDSWDDREGPGTLVPYGRYLLVVQTEGVHRQIDEVLDALRAMHKTDGDPGG